MILDPAQRPEPDVCVVRADAVTGGRQTFFRGQDVVLAVEVVSPESRVRDRKRKPVLYAEAGIPHFWRIEEQAGKPVAYVYELDPATGLHHDRLKLTVPFDLDVDLGEIDRM